MKACREIGGPLSNAGLAAAVVQGVVQYSKTKQRSPGACFSCGKQGYLKKQCPNKGGFAPGVVKEITGPMSAGRSRTSMASI